MRWDLEISQTDNIVWAMLTVEVLRIKTCIRFYLCYEQAFLFSFQVMLQKTYTCLQRLVCSVFIAPACPVLVPSCRVHHHKERHNLRLFLGIQRSNKHKANRNTHINERKFARVTLFVESSNRCSRKKNEREWISTYHFWQETWVIKRLYFWIAVWLKWLELYSLNYFIVINKLIV